jgi:nitroimidazol reductase NimA-like FMN-containing flavoprotein (pyridoxamine 5'-phosphate oxidase superfamily)
MFKEMRRRERKMDDREALELLEKGLYGVLSTIDEDGYAYGVPLSYVYIDGNIYFHCAGEGSKLDNIRHNSRVSFCVVNKAEPLPEDFSMRYESVIVFGQAQEVQGREKDKALRAILDKYSGEYIEEGLDYIRKAGNAAAAVRMSIQHIAGKARR